MLEIHILSDLMIKSLIYSLTAEHFGLYKLTFLTNDLYIDVQQSSKYKNTLSKLRTVHTESLIFIINYNELDSLYLKKKLCNIKFWPQLNHLSASQTSMPSLKRSACSV